MCVQAWINALLYIAIILWVILLGILESKWTSVYKRVIFPSILLLVANFHSWTLSQHLAAVSQHLAAILLATVAQSFSQLINNITIFTVYMWCCISSWLEQRPASIEYSLWQVLLDSVYEQLALFLHLLFLFSYIYKI